MSYEINSDNIPTAELVFSPKRWRATDHFDPDEETNGYNLATGPCGPPSNRAPLRSEREAALGDQPLSFCAEVAVPLRIVTRPACGCSDEELQDCPHSC